MPAEIKINGGSYYVGGIFGNKDFASHANTSLSPFYMTTTEIDYNRYMQVYSQAKPLGYSVNPGCNGGDVDDCLPPETDHGRHPVTTVSWWDAIIFANALSVMNHLTPNYLWADGRPINAAPADNNRDIRRDADATGFRLPTLNEWQVAARGGEIGLKHGSYGQRFSGSNAAETVANMPTEKTTEFHTQPVGSRRANPLGLYDLTGNVSEWLDDDVHMPGLNNMHYFCGGSYLMKVNNVSECDVHTPNFPTSDIGFRLVRPLR
ncbi:protein of unknown function DUF323 [Musicola paradisiaca Ech703]|uniref:Sulfatase-modifying factor enzyme-like domain-containing protein n=2 Tax=Musicola paradisiaca TaxID=69223 RepID=C6C7F1_MUSP7|nr:protein of unknown function DUF323 [Musicola paradisiaca Ech703]